MLQLHKLSPTENVVYCEHQNCMVFYDSTSGDIRNLKKQHLINKNFRGHQPEKRWICEDCGKEFQDEGRYRNHDHVAARNADLPYVDYTLVGLDTYLGKMLISRPLLEAANVCFERFYAVPSRFPFLDIPIGLRKTQSYYLWKEYANVCGIHAIEEVRLNNFSHT